MYGISTDISSTYLYTINMETAETAVVGSTGIPAGIDCAIDANGIMWVFDIVGDEIYKVDLATGASILIGSAGFDGNYGQGMGYDYGTDQVYLMAFNGSNYTTEFRILDRTTGNTNLVASLGSTQIDGLGFPGGGTTPWLSMNPTSGQVPAGSSQGATVHFDATDLANGTYTGTITFLSEPNVVTVNVPITLIVGNTEEPTVTIGEVYDVPAGPVSVPVHAAFIDNMGSFQFTIDYRSEYLAYTGASNWYPGITDVLINSDIPGKLTFVWAASTEGVTITDGTFFNLDFTFTGTTDWGWIGWSDIPTPREFADYDGNIFVPVYHNGFVTGHPVGVPEKGPQAIKVYPNPASDVVNVKSDFNIKSIEVLSFIGQTVYTENNLNTKLVQFNVSSLGSGVYFVKLNTNEGIKTTKITVKH
jgi:hypothetical protein